MSKYVYKDSWVYRDASLRARERERGRDQLDKKVVNATNGKSLKYTQVKLREGGEESVRVVKAKRKRNRVFQAKFNWNTA